MVNGGGTGYSIYAPIRVATEKTYFTMPETLVGYMIDSGSSYYFPRICNGNKHLGMMLGMLGMRVYGENMVTYGLATHYIDSSNLVKLKLDIRKNYSPGTSEDDIKEMIKQYEIIPSIFQVPHLSQIDDIFQFDSIQKVHERIF